MSGIRMTIYTIKTSLLKDIQEGKNIKGYQDIETLIRFNHLFFCLQKGHKFTYNLQDERWQHSGYLIKIIDENGYAYNSILLKTLLPGIYKWSIEGKLMSYIDRISEWWKTNKWPSPKIQITYYPTFNDLKENKGALITFYSY